MVIKPCSTSLYCQFQNLETAKSELTKFKSELELLRKQSGAGEVKVSSMIMSRLSPDLKLRCHFYHLSFCIFMIHSYFNLCLLAPSMCWGG